MIGSYPPGSPAIMVRTIRFLWQCLVGACIFAAERNFEMLLSSGHIVRCVCRYFPTSPMFSFQLALCGAPPSVARSGTPSPTRP